MSCIRPKRSLAWSDRGNHRRIWSMHIRVLRLHSWRQFGFEIFTPEWSNIASSTIQKRTIALR